MNLKSIYHDAVPSLQKIQLAADNSTYYGSGVDTQGYDGVAFFGFVKAYGAGNVATYTLKAQQDTASNYGTAADLAGTGKSIIPTASADAFGFVDIHHPQERYVRPAMVVPNIATPTVVSMFAVKYHGKYRPETNAYGEFHNAPAEGTA